MGCLLDVRWHLIRAESLSIAGGTTDKMTEKNTSKVIRVASYFVGAGLAGLLVSDFLPPVVEGSVVVIALCSLGLGAVAIAASPAVIVRRDALRHARSSGRTPVLSDRGVRLQVATTLGQMGPRAKDAIPALQEMLQDEGLRKTAAWALERIRSQE